MYTCVVLFFMLFAKAAFSGTPGTDQDFVLAGVYSLFCPFFVVLLLLKTWPTPCAGMHAHAHTCTQTHTCTHTFLGKKYLQANLLKLYLCTTVRKENKSTANCKHVKNNQNKMGPSV